MGYVDVVRIIARDDCLPHTLAGRLRFMRQSLKSVLRPE
jgi:hypothetical protein